MSSSTNASSPREIDYLAYLIDEYSDALSEWERNFCKSCINHLRTKFQFLTQKQRAIVDKLIVKHITQEDRAFCVRGFADREDHEVMNDKGAGTRSTKMAQANDDMDDDIPF
jgi:aminopeptidase-like protein